MSVKLPRYENHRLITPVSEARSRGEKVTYHERKLRVFGRLINKVSPGTFPETITTATIGDSHRKHHIKPQGELTGLRVPSAEGVRFAYSSIPLPEEIERNRLQSHAVEDSGFTVLEHIDSARLYLADGDMMAVQRYIDAGYVTPQQLGLENIDNFQY